MTTPFRIQSLPDVPTMEEAGIKGYEATQYFAAAVPKGTPDAIVVRLNAAITKAMDAKEVQAALESGGQVPGKLSPAQAQEFVQKSLARFGEVAKKANISMD